MSLARPRRPNTMTRRRFLQRAGLALVPAAAAMATSCRSASTRRSAEAPARLFFVSQGRTGLIHADGTGLRYLEFAVPNQPTWQPAGFFSDGRRVLFLSMEPRRDGPGRPFDEYYTQTPTHLWIYDLDTGGLEEIAHRERLAPFYTPQLLLSDERMLVQVVRQRVGQLFSMNLDGSDAQAFTHIGEGLPYGLSLSPDRQRVAYHLASPQGYQIWTSDVTGAERMRIAGEPGHLYFGPAWSPDGRWLAYQDCLPGADPGHDWSDVRLSRADGTEHRMLTTGQAMWFGATYGPANNHGGGSNLVAWTRDGKILFPRRLPGAKVPWEYQAHRPDIDHYNRDFKPEQARGGVEICRLDPENGWVVPLTQPGPGFWDFRASESPSGAHIVFCRAATGEAPTVWTMNGDGSGARSISRGLAEQGADHPRWLPGS